MKKLIASATAAVALLGTTPAFAANIIDVDGWTNTTDRYISGQLDSQLDAVATDPITNVLDQNRRDQQEAGVKLHCARTLDARKAPAVEKCGSATQMVSIRPARN